LAEGEGIVKKVAEAAFKALEEDVAKKAGEDAAKKAAEDAAKKAAEDAAKKAAEDAAKKAAEDAAKKAGEDAAKKASEDAARKGVTGAAARAPQVTDSKLGNIVHDLYKGANNPTRVGSGTTADAIRHELANPGVQTAGRGHVIKGREYAKGLQNWLRRNPGASAGDRQAAQDMLNDLKNALGGN